MNKNLKNILYGLPVIGSVSLFALYCSGTKPMSKEVVPKYEVTGKITDISFIPASHNHCSRIMFDIEGNKCAYSEDDDAFLPTEAKYQRLYMDLGKAKREGRSVTIRGNKINEYCGCIEPISLDHIIIEGQNPRVSTK